MGKMPSSWEDRIELINGKITRIVKAVYDRPYKLYSEIDVYKENEDGECWMRNVYQTTFNGWCVMFPGYKRSECIYCYDDSIAEEEEWSQCNRRSSIGWSRRHLTDTERGLIIMNHYDFKYVFQKYCFDGLREVMDKLIMWKLHPELELMLASKFEKLGMCKSLYRLKPENQKAVMKFCRLHPNAYDLTFREIRAAMKSDDPELFIKFCELVPAYKRKGWTRETYNYWGVLGFEDIKYLKKKKLLNKDSIELLSDYRNMLNRSIHDSNDEYWKYPSNLKKQHDKLVEEERIAREAREREEEEKRKKELKKSKSDFQRVCKKYSKYNSVIDGYSIYFSNSFDDWKKQADTLHQCIIACDYMAKVAKRQCLIAFIRKNDEPIATAEIKPGKVIGQFYANELDRSNCLPSQEVQAVFNKWLEKIVVKEVI